MKSVSFSGGLKLPAPKNTPLPQIESVPLPNILILPLKQHYGTDCIPQVEKGDHVHRGEVIAQNAQTVINAPAPGHIQAIGQACQSPDGSPCTGITLIPEAEDSPGLESQAGLKPMQAMFRAGLNDLTPQAMPLLQKIATAQKKGIQTLIVNGLDEAFVHGGQSALMASTAQDIMAGIDILQQLFRAEKILIAVYAKAEEAVHALLDQVSSDRVQVVPCLAKHPQHKDQMLIAALLHQEYPAESSPEEMGVSVVSAESAYQVAQCVRHGRSFVHKLITVQVPGNQTPRVLSVPLGTPIRDICTYLGWSEDSLGKVILGGPLTGRALFSLDVPITKEMHLLCLQNRDEMYCAQDAVCFKCGYCVQVCPMRLMPFLISGFSEGGNPELAAKNDIQSCIECGCCAYVCPAGIPLVQWIQFGKSALNAA